MILQNEFTRFSYNGISTMVVNPPAAAAFVAVSKPSHSVRPGSFTRKKLFRMFKIPNIFQLDQIHYKY